MTTFGGAALSGETVLLTGGKVFIEGDADNHHGAMLVIDGRVSSVGETEELRSRKGKGVPERELNGATVLPGLIDAHSHVQCTTLARSAWVDVRGLSPTETVAEIHAAIQRLPSDDWVIAQGTFLQELPALGDLDALSPRSPVIVRESMHRLRANSEAMRRAGLLSYGNRTPPGTVVHLDEYGKPTGLVEEGFHLFPVPEPRGDELEGALRVELRDEFASRGVTTVFEIPSTSSGVSAYCALGEAGALPTRITLNPVVSPGLNPLLEEIEDWNREDFGWGPGSDLIASGGIKIFVDGDNDQAFSSVGLRTNPPGFGAMTRTSAQLRDELIWATKNHVQVWIHAIGDLAQEFALASIAEARKRVGPPMLRTRLEHAGNLELSAELLHRLKWLDVIPVPTANFMSTDDGTGLYGYSTLADWGFEPPGNSDTGGAIAQAPSPWYGISHMVNRRNSHGVEVAPGERVSVAEGVRGYTRYAARAAGLSSVIGSLRPGSAADFAVYSVDPRSLGAGELAEVIAEETFVGGRTTWQRIT